jgi:hypothetical protein
VRSGRKDDLRFWLSAAATALALIAVVVSVVDGAQEALAFFIVAAAAGGLQTWAARELFIGLRRRISIGIAVAWLIAAAWIGVLLLMYLGASRPPPEPEATYIGLTATVYHLVALYGGAVLVSLSAFLRGRTYAWGK